MGAVTALAQFRYLRLALVVALAPVPGLLWFTPAWYPIAFALAALMASGLVGRLLKGSTEDAAFAALLDAVPGAIGALLVALGWSLWDRANSDALFFAILSVVIALPLGVIFLPFGEHFHVAANRVRETREPVARAAAGLAQPRWSFSLCGITLVFLVLGVIGRTDWPPLMDWIGCVLVAVILHAATLDWRTAGAGFVSAALLLLFGQGMTAALLLFVLLALFVAGRPDRGVEAACAWALRLEDRAVPVFFAGLGAGLTSALLDGVPQALLAFAALAAALFAFPALTLAQHHLLPRRRSVEELYS